MIRLSAFADEAGKELSAQIAALKRNGIQHLEIRGVNKKNVKDLTVAEAKEIAKALETLTKREAQVLRLRFGLDTGVTKTLEEVGLEFNVTRERIRQIEAKALRKLRHPSRSKKLKDYLIQEKVPKDMREKLLLVADGSHIMWVIGRRISSYYKVTTETKRILVLSYIEESESNVKLTEE